MLRRRREDGKEKKGEDMRMTHDNHDTRTPEKRTNQGRYIFSVETRVHDVLKYVDDSGYQRNAHRGIGRIIDPFGIAEEIGCFVVQVWMARFLSKKVMKR
jgi:hypothetical protein